MPSKDPEKRRQQRHAWYAANRDQVLEREHARYAANAEVIREKERGRRAARTQRDKRVSKLRWVHGRHAAITVRMTEPAKGNDHGCTRDDASPDARREQRRAAGAGVAVDRDGRGAHAPGRPEPHLGRPGNAVRDRLLNRLAFLLAFLLAVTLTTATILAVTAGHHPGRLIVVRPVTSSSQGTGPAAGR